MKRKKLWFSRKVMALALSLLLAVGMIPATALADTADDSGVATADITPDEKIVDNSTMNDWEKFFVDDSTEYAGGVWTDKSVFNDANAFPSSVEMLDSERNFLVALSALASNKEVVGYSTIPTDTILILDLSQSMDNSGSIPQTIEAANSAIDRLLKLNKNNRVGVVLYSGNSNFGKSKTSTGKLLLELDRYVANNNGNYITYSGNSSNTTVNIAQGVKVELTNAPVSTQNKAKTTEGGTYIQNGLDIAMDEFLGADTVIEDDNVQGGTVRMPIFVLMSDGAPTTGDPDYTNIGESSVGNGGATSAGLGFMTQLTAAYARESVEAHYGTTAKFYTLGLNLSNQDSDGQYVAGSVLDPENSLTTIDNYWDRLFANGSVSFTSPGTSTNQNNGNINVTVNRVSSDGLEREDQEYVDRYFKADGNDALIDAFGDIVDEIILQSAYYPTLVEDGELDFDGYITFEDELDQFMEVKNITGILLGDHLFSGAALTKMMSSDEFGDRYTYTELGWELVDSVAERIGVSQDVAIELLKDAWADGQLSYTSDTEFSNYIGWYEGSSGEYLGYWNDEHTDADMPEGATYISRSYGFYGSTVEEGGIIGSDMMHIVVKVRTEIATGHQDVVFQIPASLIPILTYHISLDADNFEDAENITLTKDDGAPIRLLFEVGLRSDINELNIEDVLSEDNLLTGQHVHENADGTYYFYSNQWGDGEGGEIKYDEPFTHLVAVSHFEPSVENERYYYISDTVVATDTNGTPYKGTAAPSTTGDTYYHVRTYFEGNATSAQMVTEYVPIAAETLAKHAKQAEDGTWYIEEGTVFQDNTELFRTIKIGNPANPTETLDYSDYPIINRPSAESEAYDVYDFLGNNGRLKVSPATGIKLTKLVDSTVTDKSLTYTFNVTLKDAQGNALSGEYTFVDASGTYGKIAFDANGVSGDISMKADDTVYIIGLPAGATYSVAEKDINADYTVGSVTVDGTVVDGKTASGTVEDKTLDKVVFTNTERLEGDLVVSKTITHDFGDSYVIPTDKKFDVTVELKDAKGDAFADGTKVQTSVGEMTVANGVLTFQLAHDESVTITGLPEGTTYVVTETDVPNGFTLTTAADDRAGEIVAGGSATVALVNDYEPTGNAPTADIDINVTKTVQDVEGAPIDWNNKEYTFYLEQQVDGNWVKVAGDAVTGTASSTDNTFTLKLPEGYLTDVGTYLFRVHEDEANLGAGMISDTAVYFTVIVTDKDMDGALEVDAIQMNNADVADKDKVDLSFKNTYIVTEGIVVNIPIEKTIKNDTGVTLLPEGYEFQLYEADGVTVVDGASAVSNANGDAAIYISYTSEWFNSQSKNADGNVELTYVLKENAGDMAGMDYSQASYEVKVVVGLNQTGSGLELKSLSIAGDDTDPVAAFENTYTLKATSEFDADVDAVKTISGDRTELTENDKFTFELYETGSDFATAGLDPIQSVTNDADGKIDFAAVSYTKVGTHYYVISEKQADGNGITSDTAKYHVTVVVAPGTGEQEDELVATKTVVKVGGEAGADGQIVFNNTYNADPVSLAISGDKDLEGKILEHGSFTFVLSEVTVAGDKEVKTEVSRTVNAANSGAFTFPEIKYTVAGEYQYIVEELDENKAGYTYDDSYFQVTVKVTDDGKGSLEAKVTSINEVDGADAEGVDTSIKFNNSYDPADATIALEAVKFLDNRDLTAEEFDFHLYEADEDFNITNTTAVASGTNDADGKIVFDSFTIDTAGTHHYVMKEDTAAQQMNVVYDTKEYQVTVLVYDQGGALSSHVTYTVEGVSTDSVVFSNTYFAPQTARLMVEASKTLTGRDADTGEFSFELYQTGADYNEESAGAKLLQTKSNAEDDKVLFDEIQYTVDQLTDNEAVFYYVVKEKAPAANPSDGVTYDTTEYQIQVAVVDDGTGILKQTVSVDGAIVAENKNVVVLDDTVKDLSFVNAYEHSTATLILGGSKALSGKDLEAGEYEFALYQTADDTYSLTGATKLDTTKNKADKTFTFDAITITEADTYYYVVEEVDGGNSKVDYDSTKYNIKVVAEDDGKGTLTLDVYYGDKQITDETEAVVTDLNFTNTYDPDDTVVNLSGKKNLAGRESETGEFQFKLSEITVVDGKEVVAEIDTASNGEDDTFAFDSLTFDTVGTYEYVIEEVVPADKKGVAYDPATYEVKVVVENKGKGALSQTVYVDGKEVSADAVATIAGFDFDNSYKAVLEKDAGLELSVQKNITGDRDKVEAGEFTFVLSEVVKDTVTELDTAQNDADGKVAFDKIDTYTEAGDYYYRVTETAKDAIGITYDGTVYDVKVTVTDDGEGNLVVGTPVITVNGKTVEDIVFTNTYDEPEPIDVVFNVTKLIENKTEDEVGFDGFQFKLTSGLKELATVVSDDKGLAEFAVTYTVEDIGETYTYKISEVDTDMEGMKYDKSKVEVSVTIAYVDGELVATVTQDGTAVDDVNAQFTNTYYGEGVSPVTGQPYNPFRWAGLIAAIAVCGGIAIVMGRRRA